MRMNIRWLALLGAVWYSSPVLVAQSAGPGGAQDIMDQYVQRTLAKDLQGTMDLFEDSANTYFHINGILYFTVDNDQSLFQIAAGKNDVDGWSSIQQGFSDYFAVLVEALPVQIVTRTEGQGLKAPLDGRGKIDGETNYLLLAKFYVDDQGHTGYGIVHGLDQFRIKHGRIANINNLEKSVFLSADESAYLDTLTIPAKQQWARQRTCELAASVFSSIDVEKRFDIGLPCQ